MNCRAAPPAVQDAISRSAIGCRMTTCRQGSRLVRQLVAAGGSPRAPASGYELRTFAE
jgi:hypothetical protein